ncbi:ABC transporter ATP-binding protein [Rhodospirillum rubrum]|uniref:ABC transporter ATP-binding protein n=1 Tax=Rhodospirillum rubrum TaxID=1085 RepID=UPI0035564EC3
MSPPLTGRPTPSPRAVIAVEDLVKRFGERTVVDHVNLTVDRGKICGFLGPNGSGKTTTIRMLCGLLTPDSGRGTCLGHDILRESDAIKRRVGYMTQRFGFYEDLTIAENLDFVARLYGLSQRRRRVDESLESLGLTSRRAQLAGSLSGGWKQRLALAACLLHEPDLLLLDEPTAGVDPKARREFWDHIHALAGRGLTVLVSTHYMDEAERCHEIYYLAYGRLKAHGTVEQVIASSGLSVWQVRGASVAGLGEQLGSDPAVISVTSFGTTLHVVGTDPLALERVVGRYRHLPGTTWTAVEPGLEDVFIHLMEGESGQ